MSKNINFKNQLIKLFTNHLLNIITHYLRYTTAGFITSVQETKVTLSSAKEIQIVQRSNKDNSNVQEMWCLHFFFFDKRN